MSADVSVGEYPTLMRNNTVSREIETVVIDDNESPHINQNNNKYVDVVEILSDDDENTQIYTSPETNLFEEILKKGGIMADLIEKCLELEFSDGMERIVKKTLLRYYRMADKSYLASPKFTRDLMGTLQLLDNDPHHKFTHIKRLCDKFKSSFHKKRINLITLDTNLKDKPTKLSLKRNHNNVTESAKRRKDDIIEIDDVENSEVMEVINVDEYQSDDLEINCGEKENEDLPNSQDTPDPLLCTQKEVPYIPPTNVPIPVSSTEISRLEAEIEKLHSQIKKLEEEEVTVDSELGSQYVITERLKSTLVDSYKELCTLTGSVDRKPKHIRLQVKEGHPRGPTMMLQKFVNERIEGEVFNFPDMMDVIACVEVGLKTDGLQWTRQQVMKEATALFVQCGRALQNSRQRREWKHLMYHVKKEQKWQDDDPAERDPELMAKLELNRLIAQKKETDILNKYVSLQDMPVTSRVIPSSQAQISQYDEDKSEDETISNQEFIPTTTSIEQYVSVINKEPNLVSNHVAMLDSSNNENQFTNCTDELNINTESAKNNQNDHNIDVDSENLHSQITKSVEESDTDAPIHNRNCVNKDNGYLETLDKAATIVENGHNNNDNDVENNCISVKKELLDTEVKIKTEPTEEIANLLESLGENYTVSIVDVEDPFLIIEISSDSESDDEINERSS